MTSPAPTADGLWAITSFFNPMGWSRRLANFRTFRERLTVPLVAVELAYGSDFQLQKEDADILIQLRGGAILWQKERLLNLALQALPENCRKVAWLDCDIIFGAADWAESASRLLDRFALIQMFRRAHYLSPDWTPAKDCATEVEFARPAVIFSIASGLPATTCIGHLSDTRGEATCAKGLAWAVRRELIDQHGFFDACIIGGGDTALAGAAKYCSDAVMEAHHMNERQQARYVAWAKPFSERVRGEVGYLDADIFHLWHGNFRHRRAHRHEGLQRFRFDPFTDIAFAANGCWLWATEKPDMHDYVRNYFSSRREDG